MRRAPPQSSPVPLPLNCSSSPTRISSSSYALLSPRLPHRRTHAALFARPPAKGFKSTPILSRNPQTTRILPPQRERRRRTTQQRRRCFSSRPLSSFSVGRCTNGASIPLVRPLFSLSTPFAPALDPSRLYAHVLFTVLTEMRTGTTTFVDTNWRAAVWSPPNLSSLGGSVHHPSHHVHHAHTVTW